MPLNKETKTNQIWYAYLMDPEDFKVRNAEPHL